MPYVIIEDFRGGLDSRRDASTLAPGSLVELTNAHVTRGGEIEKRKAMPVKFDLTGLGTFGLAELKNKLYTFGSVEEPTLPDGLFYIRLQSPTDSPMSAIIDTDVFDEAIYAIAQFEDGGVHHFYDGEIIEDWANGTAGSSGSENLFDVASLLSDEINESDDFIAENTGPAILITGLTGIDFSITAEASNGGDVDDQTATVIPSDQALVSEGGQAFGSIEVTATSSNAGVDYVASLKVGDTELLQSNVGPFYPEATMAAALAANINSNAGINAIFGASNAGAVVNIFTVDKTDAYNGEAIVASSAGEVVLSNVTDMELGFGPISNPYQDAIAATDGNPGVASFEITGGSVGSGNAISAVAIGETSLIDSSVDFVTSLNVTAAAVANQIINDSVGFTAIASNASVIISTLSNTSAFNGSVLLVSNAGDVTVGSVQNMTGGVDPISGQAKKVAVLLDGTFEEADKYSIILAGKAFGAKGNPFGKGVTAIPLGSKMYATAGSLLYFSAINSATKWNSDELGAGFINMSTEGGSGELTGLAVYNNQMAVFARSVIQLWAVYADDDSNVQLQILRNSGTVASRSVTSYGGTDVYYLGDSGVRSLRARDISVDTAAVNDVGTAIDTLVRAYMDTLTEEVISRAVGIIEPIDGRYWLAIGGKIFVFSYFPGSKINAWSEYDIGEEVSDVKVVGDKVYVRTGDKIRLYGGDSGNLYDKTKVRVRLPFLSVGKPKDKKALTSIDIAGDGTWYVTIAIDPNDLSNVIKVGNLSGVTYPYATIPAQAETTHFAPILESEVDGRVALFNMAIGYSLEGE